MAGLLPKWGHEVLSVSTGEQAWAALDKAESPYLLILNWMMPALSGVDLCQRLRSRRPRHPYYIILLTGKNRPEEIAQALDAGADDYITKPFHAEELRARIQVGCRVLDFQSRLAQRERFLGALRLSETVCHEFNQPLQAVLSATELLLMDERVSSANQELVLAIKQGVERLGKVTREVMVNAHAGIERYVVEGESVPEPPFL